MSLKSRLARRACLWMLTVLMAAAPLYALAEAVEETGEEIGAAKYYAVSTIALKVRIEPDKDAKGVGSIPQGTTIDIYELTNENWAYVAFDRGMGYVQRQYMENLTAYDGSAIVEPTKTPEPVEDGNGFRKAYKAYALKEAGLREKPDQDARWLDTVHTYDMVYVSEVDGDWCYATYDGRYGYIRTKDLFKWDRMVVDAGEIPGLDIMPLMAFVNKTTNIYSVEDNQVLRTVNPGAALAVFEKDEQGRYTLPYWRTLGYIRDEDVAYVMEVADYETAQPGELISVMSTYYAVGVSTVQFQNRNWNIHLASSMINGYVLQPGEDYDQYQVIGPYRKSTGYKSAPIMKKDALTGYGGGTCQVNTTFYITTIQVPIIVTHRVVHAEVGIYYAKQGFDAAVGGGNINLTLTNTLPYTIRYQFFDSDGVLTCCIFRDS